VANPFSSAATLRVGIAGDNVTLNDQARVPWSAKITFITHASDVLRAGWGLAREVPEASLIPPAPPVPAGRAPDGEHLNASGDSEVSCVGVRTQTRSAHSTGHLQEPE